MTTSTEFFTQFTDWEADRTDLQERDGEGINPVSSSEWHDSDDAGFGLLQDAVHLLRQPVKIWSLTIGGPGYGRTATTSLHLTEEACWESLRENYDDEGECDKEPPVAIVAWLEDRMGFSIHIDVHEVTR